jgi:hypothetical protein
MGYSNSCGSEHHSRNNVADPSLTDIDLAAESNCHHSCRCIRNQGLSSPSLEMVQELTCYQEVSTSRSRFPKPVHQYTVLSFFGHNIVASEGDEWKKYRKISAPAFSDVSYRNFHTIKQQRTLLQRNNKMVWDETVKIMDDLFQNVWGNQAEITTDHCVEITLPVRSTYRIVSLSTEQFP